MFLLSVFILLFCGGQNPSIVLIELSIYILRTYLFFLYVTKRMFTLYRYVHVIFAEPKACVRACVGAFVSLFLCL